MSPLWFRRRGNEKHFLFYCSLYHDLSFRLFSSIICFPRLMNGDLGARTRKGFSLARFVWNAYRHMGTHCTLDVKKEQEVPQTWKSSNVCGETLSFHLICSCLTSGSEFHCFTLYTHLVFVCLLLFCYVWGLLNTSRLSAFWCVTPKINGKKKINLSFSSSYFQPRSHTW